MLKGDVFRSCCDALDRLLDGIGAETTPEMDEEERAKAIIHAARRDHPFTEAFWQRYRRPDGEDQGGSQVTHYERRRQPGYRQGTGRERYGKAHVWKDTGSTSQSSEAPKDQESK